MIIINEYTVYAVTWNKCNVFLICCSHIKFVSLLLETSWHTYGLRAVDGQTDRQTRDETSSGCSQFHENHQKRIICCRPYSLTFWI